MGSGGDGGAKQARRTVNRGGAVEKTTGRGPGSQWRASAAGQAGKKRGFAIGKVKTKQICAFTRQLSILQDAGLPILRSLKILENNQKGGKLKFALMDVCEEIEGGATLSEAMAKSPKVFSRLYVNMIKAGEAGGALETILQRLAEEAAVVKS